MTDVVTVLTTPKRTQYLADTVARLDVAGARNCNTRIVVSDGWGVRPINGWLLSISWMAPRGPRAAMWSVFEAALEAGADRLLYFEDDVLPAPAAVDRMRAVQLHGQQALVSFFDAKEFPGARRAKPGIYDVPVMGQDGKGLFGACALLIPRRTLVWLTSRPQEAWGDPWPGDPEPADLLVSWALREGPWPLRGVAIPSLFEHVGRVSSMAHNAGRAAWFEGA